MFETLQRLYTEEKIGTAELNNAIAKGWITEKQKEMIVGE